MQDSNLLKIEDLSVDYKSPSGNVPALRDVSLSLKQGEILSIVGESGSGKTTLALAVSRLLTTNTSMMKNGKIIFRGRDITNLKAGNLDKLRGTEIFMIFQNPFMSLNPLMRIKDQIREAIQVRDKRSGQKESYPKILNQVTDVLKAVRIGDAGDIMERYPHQLSGGQNQRIMLAMALVERPSLLIADEPTTALDVTTQAQVLLLLKEIIKETRMSVIFITHDLAVAGSISDRIAVLYGGMIQEIGSSKQILYEPKHPYTVSLIKSIPSKSKGEGYLDAIKGSFQSKGIENMCAFYPRCPLAHDECKRKIPSLMSIGKGVYVRCVNYGEAAEDVAIE
ncbi:MAG TPA: ABC transporter ATP-binding protein [Nitrososphaerales archaeon]|nr:ABC transporter ATP-binding protein [Nitrososphaerales archaeon]